MTDLAKPKNHPAILLLVLAALGVYLVLFYATRMPSLEDVLPGQEASEKVFRRADFLVLLLCPEILLQGWLGTPPEFSLADRLPVLAIAGLILAVAAAVGWLLMKACRADRGLTGLETVVFSTAVGLNVLSTYVLAIGLAGLLRYRLVVVVPSVLAVARAFWSAAIHRRFLALFAAGRLSRDPSRGVPPRVRADTARLGVPLSRRGSIESGDKSPHSKWLWLAVPFVLVIVLGAMLPPVDFDVREYHLQAPKEFYQTGRIGFLPHNVYGNMAMGTEMLSLLAMTIAGDWWLGALAGKTLIAAFAPLAALALLAAGRRFFSPGDKNGTGTSQSRPSAVFRRFPLGASPIFSQAPSVGIVAALVYLSIPWVVDVSTAGLVEGASACYLLLAVYGVLLWREASPASLGRLLLAGYLAGAAVATKYPAVLFVLVPLAAWVAWSVRKDGRTGARSLLLFLLAAGVACGLWFGKNAVLTGNPTYPLLYNVFGGETWTPEKDRQWNRVHRPHDFSPGRLARDLGRVGLRSEWLSPLVVPLAALAFLTRKNRRLLLALAAYVAYVLAVWWLFTHRIDRFWIPVLPVLALLAGAGAGWSASRTWRTVLAVGLVAALVVNFLMVSSAAPGKDNRYFLRLSRLRNDPLRVDAWHGYFNAHAPKGRLLLVGDAEVFDLSVPILYNTCFDDCLFEQLVKGKTSSAIRSGLASQGITHVFVHWGEIDRYRRSSYGFTEFAQPIVFDRLVAQGILRPLPALEGHPGRAYEVVPMERRLQRRTP